MKQQKTKDTGPELALRRALRARRVAGYRTHVRVLPELRRTSDLAFIGARVVVDVRGCFWHGCPEHPRRGTSNAAWWNDKIQANLQRDKDTEQRLTTAGWLVVVVWEHEDPIDAADRVCVAISSRRKRGLGSPATPTP